MTRAWAPQGADRFYNLVRHHFYNDVAFFRVGAEFIVQFGLGPSPAVNRAWENAKIKDDPVTQSNMPGDDHVRDGRPEHARPRRCSSISETTVRSTARDSLRSGK